jgi:ABC-type transporter Mla MlaB component
MPGDLDRRLRGIAWSAGTGPLVCDVGAIVQVDIATIDLLARMALAARRAGHDLWLVRAPDELRRLVGLCGLAGVIRCGTPDQAVMRAGRPKSGK